MGLWRQQSFLASQGVAEITAFNGSYHRRLRHLFQLDLPGDGMIVT
jgi:hypothetical protein